MITPLINSTIMYDACDAISHCDSVRYDTFSTLQYDTQCAARFGAIQRCYTLHKVLCER